MGITLTKILDGSNVDVTVYVEDYCGRCYTLAHVTNGSISLQETGVITNDTELAITSRSFVGEISADLCVKSKHMHLCESEKIIMKTIYTLPDANIGIPKFQGLGHVTLKNNRKCTSVQFCLEDLVINDTVTPTTVTATYSGCLERNFVIECCDNAKLDACVTFMITSQTQVETTFP